MSHNKTNMSKERERERERVEKLTQAKKRKKILLIIPIRTESSER